MFAVWAAWLRIVRASARTMAHEAAARWCWKKDWALGRCAAEAVMGGVVPLRVVGRLVQHMEEADHFRREGASGLRREQVCDVTFRERVG